MRTSLVVVSFSAVFAGALLIALALAGDNDGNSTPEAASRPIAFPPALARLGTGAWDIAVDDSNMTWIPILDFTDDADNTLYRYDPAADELRSFVLPADPEASTTQVRIEAGRGVRAGKLVIGWNDRLFEVDGVTGEAKQLPAPFDISRLSGGPPPVDPATGEMDLERLTGHAPPSAPGILDLALDGEGRIWLTSGSYPYLVAIEPDGAVREYRLPVEAGEPETMAVDGEGRVWATLTKHRPVAFGSQAVNTGAYTLRFDPKTEEFDLLSVTAWDIAAGGDKVVALGGQGPGLTREFRGDDAVALNELDPKRLTDPDHPPTAIDSLIAVAVDRSVWYTTARTVEHLQSVGTTTVYELPVSTFPASNTFGGCLERCEDTITTSPQITDIAVAPDGSLWFAAGTVGHAIP